MSDIYEGHMLIDAAGYYEAGQEDPDEAEVHPHAALPSVADLVAERDQLRGWLQDLVRDVQCDAISFECFFCGGDCESTDDPSAWYTNDPTVHDADCPWRQAKEYVHGLEVKS